MCVEMSDGVSSLFLFPYPTSHHESLVKNLKGASFRFRVYSSS